MREQTAQRGVRLYDQYIRSQVEGVKFGKYIAIDVNINHDLDYEIGDDQINIAERIQARQPDAILYTLRIGYPTVVTLRRRFVQGRP